MARVAIDVLAEFIVAKTKEHKQTRKLTFSSIHLMESLSKYCYENGSETEIQIPIIVARQIVQKGMDDPLPNDKQSTDFFEFQHNLPQLTGCIKRLGNFAIANDDVEFLYRCFDAFGWLGCSAVKHQNSGITTVCLRALSQLGREVRVKRLECFWDKCPVRPEDHAIERVGWIASWIPQMPKTQQEHWQNLIEGAYSRFLGKETTIEFITQSNGEVSTKALISPNKYIERYMMRAGSREVDYSDFNFLKDLEFHGFMKGAVMQGPVTPIFPDE